MILPQTKEFDAPGLFVFCFLFYADKSHLIYSDIKCGVIFYRYGEDMGAMYNSVAIIGGDKRQLFCAKAFADEGLRVTLGGFELLKSVCNIEITSPLEAALCSELIVLPLPPVKGEKLNAPFSKSDILFDAALVRAMNGKKVFCGMKDKLLNTVNTLNPDLIFDYSTREEFAVMNAVSTAEGAVEIAMHEFEGTINGSRCLVCGYGRIGKVLSRILLTLGADVTVSARKQSDLAWIDLSGYKSVYTSSLISQGQFDIIFNTIPALIFDSKLLSHIAKNSIVIDLASMPGGVDFSAASRLDICTVHALSLPGKSSPKSAGEIIKNTIINMLEEDDRWKRLA